MFDVYERLETIGENVVAENAEHKTLVAKSIELFSQIQDALPEDKKHLILLLEETENEVSSILQIAAYKGAITDVQRLLGATVAVL